MGLSYVPAISTGLLLPTGILQQIGQTLGDTDNILWIPGGWSVASAVSFAIAGGLSDIFGRRWVSHVWPIPHTSWQCKLITTPDNVLKLLATR